MSRRLAGVHFMITIFDDFDQCTAKIGDFLENQCIENFPKAVILVKIVYLVSNLFRKRKYFKNPNIDRLFSNKFFQSPYAPMLSSFCKLNPGLPDGIF
jgi:hypothetical protein